MREFVKKLFLSDFQKESANVCAVKYYQGYVMFVSYAPDTT